MVVWHPERPLQGGVLGGAGDAVTKFYVLRSWMPAALRLRWLQQPRGALVEQQGFQVVVLALTLMSGERISESAPPTCPPLPPCLRPRLWRGLAFPWMYTCAKCETESCHVHLKRGQAVCRHRTHSHLVRAACASIESAIHCGYPVARTHRSRGRAKRAAAVEALTCGGRSCGATWGPTWGATWGGGRRGAVAAAGGPGGEAGGGPPHSGRRP